MAKFQEAMREKQDKEKKKRLILKSSNMTEWNSGISNF